MNRLLQSAILTLLFLLFPVLSLEADTVTLKNGSRIEGLILNQNRTSVKIRIKGKVRTIAKKSIRRIAYGALPKEDPRIKADKKAIRQMSRSLRQRENALKALEKKIRSMEKQLSISRSAELKPIQLKSVRNKSLRRVREKYQTQARKFQELNQRYEHIRGKITQKKARKLLNRALPGGKPALLSTRPTLTRDVRETRSLFNQLSGNVFTLKQKVKRLQEALRIQLRESKKIVNKITPIDKKQPRKPVSLGSVLWRSAVLPGWGHWHAGRRTAAYVYGGLFATTLLNYQIAIEEQTAILEEDDTVGFFQFSVISGFLEDAASTSLSDGQKLVRVIFISSFIEGLMDGPSEEELEDANTRADNAPKLILAVYLTSLVHAYFIGRKSAQKAALGEFERRKTSLDFALLPERGGGTRAFVNFRMRF